MLDSAARLVATQRPNKPRLRNAAVLMLVGLSSVGCWGRSNTQLAGGTVAVDGKPVTMGKVTFYPVEGGRTGSGRIRPDGTFILSYRQPGDGVPIGEYKVSIISDLWEERPSRGSTRTESDALELEDAAFQVSDGTLIHVVPTKYNAIETTPLIVTVTESGEQQQFDFDIPSK